VIETSESAFYMLTESLLHVCNCPLRLSLLLHISSLLSISPPLTTQHTTLSITPKTLHPTHRSPAINEMTSSSCSSAACTQSGNALIIALHEATSAKIDALSAQMKAHHSQSSTQIRRLDQNLGDFKADSARVQSALGLQSENAEKRLLEASV
jgi:hypothetical protein